MAEEYLTVEQLAERLGWSPKTVRNKMWNPDVAEKFNPRVHVFTKGVH